MAGLGDYIKGGVEDLKKHPAPLIVGLILAGIAGSIPVINLATTGICQVGMQTMVYKIKKGETPAIGDVFSRTDMDAIMIGVPSAGIGLLSLVNTFAIGSGALAMLLSLLSLVVGIALVWAPLIQATKKGPFMESFTGSLSFWGKDPVTNLITLIVCGIVGALGVIACGIGVLATAPIAMCAIMGYYLDKSGQAPAAAAAPAAA
jgi:hypothetical protein